MLNSKIYRLLTGKCINKTIDGKDTTREVIWNKLEYASDDFDKAYQMYNRLVNEGYQYLMLTIDFGIMPTGEYLIQAAGKFNVGTKYNQLTPYLIVAECLEGHNTNKISNTELIVTTKGRSRHYTDIREAMRHFMSIVDGSENAKLEKVDHMSDILHPNGTTRIRTIATAKAVRNADKYRPCGKIRTVVINYYEGWSDDQIANYKAHEAAIA